MRSMTIQEIMPLFPLPEIFTELPKHNLLYFIDSSKITFSQSSPGLITKQLVERLSITSSSAP